MNRPRRETILIVDDQEENLRVVSHVLTRTHYEVLLASNAEEAFLQLARQPPDLILLDVMIPGVDGLTICARLKSHPRWADIPVIFLSADDDKNSIVQALEAGGVDYVTKPFNRAELVSRVRTQLALKHTQDRLRTLAEDKDEILGILAHDLKNSLAGMKLSAGLLQTKSAELPPTCSSLVDNIMDATERMLAFMQQFLANQRAEHLQIKHIPVSLGDVLTRVISRHRPVAQVKKITLTAHMPEFPVHVTGDPEGVSQVLENLISNALKFSSPGCEVVVTVEAPAAGVVKCHVRDNGPGFTAEDRARLFHRYGRLSAQPTGHESSTGLGLFIVKRLVDAMSGTITLAESAGYGAEFIITWPLAHTHA